MRKPLFLNNPVAFLLILIASCSLSILIFSSLRLPATGDHHFLRETQDVLFESEDIGFFGKMMIEMLPDDLVFTAFVPSEKAFRDLGLKLNNSRQINPKEDEDGDNTYAVVSRIMSFSVVPYKVVEVNIRNDETASYESLSGFTLRIWKKTSGGGLVVNGVETKKTGLKKGKIIIHTMDGVIMDSDFAQSLASSTPEDEHER